jgi:hypothetical protein
MSRYSSLVSWGKLSVSKMAASGFALENCSSVVLALSFSGVINCLWTAEISTPCQQFSLCWHATIHNNTQSQSRIHVGLYWKTRVMTFSGYKLSWALLCTHSSHKFTQTYTQSRSHQVSTHTNRMLFTLKIREGDHIPVLFCRRSFRRRYRYRFNPATSSSILSIKFPSTKKKNNLILFDFFVF